MKLLGDIAGALVKRWCDDLEIVASSGATPKGSYPRRVSLASQAFRSNVLGDPSLSPLPVADSARHVPLRGTDWLAPAVTLKAAQRLAPSAARTGVMLRMGIEADDRGFSADGHAGRPTADRTAVTIAVGPRMVIGTAGADERSTGRPKPEVGRS